MYVGHLREMGSSGSSTHLEAWLVGGGPISHQLSQQAVGCLLIFEPGAESVSPKAHGGRGKKSWFSRVKRVHQRSTKQRSPPPQLMGYLLTMNSLVLWAQVLISHD